VAKLVKSTLTAIPADPDGVAPTQWKKQSYRAAKSLWLAGWDMKDVARLTGLTLVEVARAVSSSTRSLHRAPKEPEPQAG
jgi:hypothetical protein